jgi:hypothetical protein
MGDVQIDTSKAMETEQKNVAGPDAKELPTVFIELALGSALEDPNRNEDGPLFLDSIVRRIESIVWQRKLLSHLKVAAPGGIYSPLDKNRKQIRLLSLAAATKRSDLLQGELNVVSLNQDPKFMALSYV